MRGYIGRVNEAVEGIQRDDGWFALDSGDKEKTSAEAEIGDLIGSLRRTVAGPEISGLGAS
jgi:hypothetical protein